VTRYLPISTTPVADISDGLVSLGFDVIIVKQMSTIRRSPAVGTTTVNIPFFLITLPRMSKFYELFKLRSLCRISVRVEAYKTSLVSISVIFANNSAMSGLTASKLPVVCGVGAVTCGRNVWKRATTNTKSVSSGS
jgi:hypothetical protein